MLSGSSLDLSLVAVNIDFSSNLLLGDEVSLVIQL